MVAKLFITYGLFLFLISTSFGQTNSQIYEQNEQLKQIKNEINRLEGRLGDKEKEEMESLKILDLINQQTLQLNKLINKLEIEERAKEKEINKISGNISTVEKRINNLKDEYGRYVVWIYKNSKSSFFTFLFNAESINQAIIRYKYLKSITARNQEVITELKENKEQLTSLSDQYRVEVSKKEALVSQKKTEQNILGKRKNEKEELVDGIKNDQQTLEQMIRTKQQQEIQIKNIIARLIEEERQRQAKLREAKLKNEDISAIADYNYDNYESFVDLKNKLNWPIAKGSIFRKFGENVNEKLKTVTLNYGIDLKAEKNAVVQAVAQGRVSVIDWIPGYGTIVIITHKGNFRTVYGHLIDIYVNEGDEVLGGTQLARVSDSLEGRIMHFEIWNERNYQNPEQWLMKK
ncbi:MAG: peptidoglycan DD-metalloendopeptidase family protein [Bacteroidetes bacterium]|nr:peptidoglycan DD-metalloendopeptidase family protein [Bacteroidota bacterium]